MKSRTIWTITGSLTAIGVVGGVTMAMADAPETQAIDGVDMGTHATGATGAGAVTGNTVGTGVTADLTIPGSALLTSASATAAEMDRRATDPAATGAGSATTAVSASSPATAPAPDAPAPAPAQVAPAPVQVPAPAPQQVSAASPVSAPSPVTADSAD